MKLYIYMSFIENIIQDNPHKYESLIESRILAKQLDMKINQYNALQNQYDKLIQQETVNRKPASGGNENIKGKLKQISAAGKNWLWGVNSGDGIYTCKKPCTDSKWIKMPGSLTQIEGGDNEVWGVNSVNNIYKMNQDHSNNWKYIPGKLTNISQGGGWVWGVNSSHNVYRCKQPCDGKWILDTAPVNDDWILVFRQTNNDWKWSRYNGGTRNIVNNNAANYSQLQNLENYRGDDGKLTFLMTYPANKTLTSPQIWKQTTNPYTVRNNRNGQVDGYEAISVPYKGTNWGGLRWNGKYSLMSGSTNGWWWYALGSFKPFGNNLIPGANNTQVNKTELYVKNHKKNSTNQGPSLVQLSCSNTHVYGLDTDKRAWRKNIDGSGEWSKFGNPWSWQFYQINASSSNGKVMAITMSRVIVETDKNGSEKWKRSSSAGGASGISTVSGDSQNEDFYFTNTNDQIYRNTPITSGGYWSDIKNENYMAGVAGPPKQSNANWKYLGQTNNVTECKIKAVQDKKNEYASIVYTTDNGDYDKTCYGGIKGGKTNPTYVKGITTSLAPNGNTRLGGEVGNKILKEMKKIHNEIKKISKQAEKDNIGLQKSNNLLNINKSTQEQELTQLLKKLSNDRKKINKILNEPDELGAAEESGFRQTSNYYMYLLWILLVLVSFVLSYHIISTDNESISTLAYVFIAIWILILGRYYYEKTKSYGVTILNYISTIFVNPV